MLKAYNQSDAYSLLYEFDKKAIFFNVDIFGNIYISDGSVLFKYDDKFQLLHSYADFSMGTINSIDVSNPMKILLFSKDLMHIVFLNNKLAEQNSSYLLSELGIIQAAAVATSYDNGFWIYDVTQDVLIRFDASAKKTYKSQPLSTLINEKINPDFMLEIDGKHLIMCNKNYGFFIFDKFGTYLKSIPFLGIKSFSVWNTKLVFVVDKKIYLLSINNIDIQSFDLPDANATEIIIKGKRLILLTKEQKVKVYELNN